MGQIPPNPCTHVPIEKWFREADTCFLRGSRQTKSFLNQRSISAKSVCNYQKMISVFGFRGPKTFFQTPLGGKGNQKVSRGKNLLKSVVPFLLLSYSYFGDRDLSSDKLRWEGKLKIAFNTNTFLGGNSKKAYQEKNLLKKSSSKKPSSKRPPWDQFHFCCW